MPLDRNPLLPSTDAIPVAFGSLTDAAPLPNPDLVGLSVTISSNGDYVIHKTAKCVTVTVALADLELFNRDAANELAGAVASSDRAQKMYRFCRSVDVKASASVARSNR